MLDKYSSDVKWAKGPAAGFCRAKTICFYKQFLKSHKARLRVFSYSFVQEFFCKRLSNMHFAASKKLLGFVLLASALHHVAGLPTLPGDVKLPDVSSPNWDEMLEIPSESERRFVLVTDRSCNRDEMRFKLVSDPTKRNLNVKSKFLRTAGRVRNGK